MLVSHNTCGSGVLLFTFTPQARERDFVTQMGVLKQKMRDVTVETWKYLINVTIIRQLY